MSDRPARDAARPDAQSRAVRAVGALMAVPRVLIGALILVSIAINFANVLGRYLFMSPIIWAEEVMIFIMVWCVFLGAALVSWEGRHLRMDLVSVAIASPWKEAVNLVATLAFLVVCGFVAVQSWEAVTLFARLGQKSTTAGVPMVIPHAALLAGLVLMVIAVAARFRAHVTGALEREAEELARRLAGDADGPEAPARPGRRG